eukprot:TRINITY_DN8755_c0_g1_i1.p1 TRINITY_DN8755_c0_g1~~TRINITY_DN8755_c0_g1_i1.p1  ORF type:complete len:291 (+),score=110.81 TRINITY_DN8755_c0_g1_i1:50-922(+)
MVYTEPASVSDLLADFTEGGSEAKADACVALFSVGHCPEVRDAFLACPQAVTALCHYIGDISKAAYTVRWEALALMGELCRRERQVNKNPDDPINVQNARAEKIAHAFAASPALEDTLKCAAKEEAGGAEIASDLLSALPFPSVAGWKTKAKDLFFLDPRLDRPWPRVTRASSMQCIGCGGAVLREKSLRCTQCKSVYYCGAECQKKHWKAGHKTRCKHFVAADKLHPLSNEARLFLPTRAQMYMWRPKQLQNTTFHQYFFEYILPAEELPADLLPPTPAQEGSSAPASS